MKQNKDISAKLNEKQFKNHLIKKHLLLGAMIIFFILLIDQLFIYFFFNRNPESFGQANFKWDFIYGISNVYSLSTHFLTSIIFIVFASIAIVFYLLFFVFFKKTWYFVISTMLVASLISLLISYILTLGMPGGPGIIQILSFNPSDAQRITNFNLGYIFLIISVVTYLFYGLINLIASSKKINTVTLPIIENNYFATKLTIVEELKSLDKSIKNYDFKK